MRKKRRLWLGRALRLAAWTLLGGVALFCVAAALVNRLVTPERLRAMIVAQLEDTFHRPVSVAKVNLLLHQGIKVTGLEVRERPEFPGEVLLSSDFLIVKCRLWPLLRGRVELSKVLLMSPRIFLRRRADGAWNAQDLLRPSGSAPARLLPPLQVADVIAIERGVLKASDAAGAFDLAVSDFQLSVRDFNAQRPFSVEASFVNDGEVSGRRLSASVDLRTQVSLGGGSPEAGFVQAERLSVSAGGARLLVSGRLQDFGRPRVELKLDLPRIESVALSSYVAIPSGVDVPASQWRVRGAVGEGGEYLLERVEGSVGPVRLVASGVLASTGASRLTVSVPQTSLQDVAPFYVGLAERQISGTASGSLTLAGPLPRLQPDRLNLSLKGFSALLRGSQRVSEADASISFGDGFRTMALSATRGTYVAYGHGLSDLALDVRTQDGDMAVRRLEATWRGSRVKLRGCVRNVAAPREVTVAASVDKLRVDETLAAAEQIIRMRKAELGQPLESRLPWATAFRFAIPASFPDFRGRLTVGRAYSPNFSAQNLELLWDLRNISRGLREVDGQFRIGLGAGRVADIPEVRAAHRLLNVLLLPYVYMHELNAKAVFSLDSASPKTLDFDHVRSDFGVAKGVTEVRMLHVHSAQLQAYADGRLNFPAEKVDLHVLMRLAQQRGQLPDRMVDTRGRPSLELYLKDDLNKPTPELTMRKLGANDIEEALSRGLGRARGGPPLEQRLDCGGRS